MSVVNKNWTEADVIAQAIGDRSTRDAAEWLSEKLPNDFKISHASVHNWTEGAYKPTYGFLFALQLFYEKDDERYQMAGKLLQMRRDNERSK